MGALIMLILLETAVDCSARVEQDPMNAQSTDSWLQYDNGTPYWAVWDGSWRGVWFNTGDFWEEPCSIDVSGVEIWFYHHDYYPWDTSMTLMELYTGDSSGGPETLIDSCCAVANHYTWAYFDLPDEPVVPQNFWVVQNTQPFSSFGFPSPLADNGSGREPAHSFFYDGTFQPMVRGGINVNLFFRAETSVPLSLGRVTWAKLKSVF